MKLPKASGRSVSLSRARSLDLPLTESGFNLHGVVAEGPGPDREAALDSIQAFVESLPLSPPKMRVLFAFIVLGRQKEAAEHLGLSRGYVSAVIGDVLYRFAREIYLLNPRISTNRKGGRA